MSHVTYFDKVTDLEGVDMQFSALLARIKNGAWRDIVEPARLLRREEYSAAKRKAPAFTIACRMSSRSSKVPMHDKIVSRTGYVGLDIDGKDNPKLTLQGIKGIAQRCPHLLWYFDSFGGDGLKVVLQGDAAAPYESLWHAGANWFKGHGVQVDRGAKDITRLCFVSWDPDQYTAQSATPLVPVEVSRKAKEESHGTLPPNTTPEDIEELLSWIPSNPEYGLWIEITSSVFNSLPKAVAMELLHKWSPERKPGEYEQKYRSRLSTYTVGTLYHYAQQQGFDATKHRTRVTWLGKVKIENKLAKTEESILPLPDEDEHHETDQIEISEAFVLQCFNRAQEGDADLFALYNGGKYRHDYVIRKWRVYKDRIWVVDNEARVESDMARVLCDTYQCLLESDTFKGWDKEAQDKFRLSVIKRMHSLNTANYQAGVLTIAKRKKTVTPEQMDSVKGLLCCENGVLHLDMNGCDNFDYRHDPNLMITKKVPVIYLEGARCDGWKQFLHKCHAGNRDVIDFLQRCVGYWLSDYTNEDYLFFHYGSGANGKSTFFSCLESLMGSMCITLDSGVLLGKNNGNSTDSKKAELEGARLVITDELPRGCKLDSATVKSLIGGDKIAARRLYADSYSFAPTHKLCMMGNHEPAVPDSDYGIWRRILKIPWVVQIPVEERKTRTHFERMFKNERSGILNWAIEGWQQYKAQGLNPPELVTSATAAFRADEDQLGRFLAECTEPDPTGAFSVKTTAIWQKYRAWCDDNGERMDYAHGKSLIKQLEIRGYEKHKQSKNQIYLKGFTLVEEDEDQVSWVD
jgi:P4 family phage/plasmid primase-like protien